MQHTYTGEFAHWLERLVCTCVTFLFDAHIFGSSTHMQVSLIQNLMTWTAVQQLVTNSCCFFSSWQISDSPRMTVPSGCCSNGTSQHLILLCNPHILLIFHGPIEPTSPLCRISAEVRNEDQVVMKAQIPLQQISPGHEINTKPQKR